MSSTATMTATASSSKTTPDPLVPAGSKHTTGDLRYFQPAKDGSRPYQLMYEDPRDPTGTNIEHVPYNTPIYDLRPLVDAGKADLTHVDVTGFQVLPKDVAKTSMRYDEWDDPAKVEGKYYDEVKDLFKRALGATHVIIFDHTIRKRDPPGTKTADTPDSRKPVSLVHIDQTPASGLTRVHRHAGADAERLLKGRKAQLINLWRPLRGPVQDVPLAVADARSLDAERDLIPSRLIYRAPQAEGETYQVARNERHRWYYVSEMQPDEALLLKCWDRDGGARTPHTAFVDDAFVGRDDVEPRQSIEVRALVFVE